ncbi:hypothetical protein RQP53_17545 [Paucibacter sp. APW11]|uniref:Uncharacterized protein n=1 Tax=Roseateles aquae TaxID=3077235 RepID=A0ABU3PFZ4_9BURK|nr:hypothetical protein [Paucibacter sp. APW11]MDT9001087.1 hypothetical protein [Paucibacter sp. APW11]
MKLELNSLRKHWFLLLAPLIVAVDCHVGLSSRGAVDRLIEAGLLFDLAAVVPGLYWLCYRRRGRPALVRAVALACLGVWVALQLVPEPERDLLNYAAPLRYLGLAALFWFELALGLAVYRSIFKGASTEQALAQAPKDLPPWVAKLMALEAGLWRRAWSVIKRLLRWR